MLAAWCDPDGSAADASGPALGMHMRSPTREYQRVISCAAFGLLFAVSGIVGWDLSHSSGWFRGATWVDGPIWWQIGLGSALLLLAGILARRVPSRPTVR